jgi:hypothetical protein
MSIRDWQLRLKGLDFDPGPVDGKWGPQTEVASMHLADAFEPAAVVVPSLWLPLVPMTRIIVHWTAGTYSPASIDLALHHYHIVMDETGKLYRGVSIERNSGSLKPGYAAHTLNCNTGAIGVALCGMYNAVEQPFSPGPTPITFAQWNRLPIVLAELCRHYAIKPEPKTLLSHAEVQSTLGIPQRGKWDIACLPFNPLPDGAREVGDIFRAATKGLLNG